MLAMVFLLEVFSDIYLMSNVVPGSLDGKSDVGEVCEGLFIY